MKLQFRSPKGVPDILPKDQKYWDFIIDTVEKRAQSFGFEKIILPIFEESTLYQKGTGINTDIVQKEMYNVTPYSNLDKETDKEYALRPEFTPGIIRSYLEHGMHTKTQPVKLLSIGPVFRHDKPQKGRYRQFWQFNLEAVGSKNPLTDALLILLIYQVFVDLGLKNKIVLEINNIGCKKCQPRIRKKLIKLLEPLQSKLCPTCQDRIYSNPLRVIDCKNKKCQKVVSTLPHIIDFICTDCKKDFTHTLEYLDDLKVAYDLNPYLVRGLDYYTGTTFEIRDKDDPQKLTSLGGGGHYDGLIKLYGGPDTPAIGFAGGVERVVEKLKSEEIKLPSQSKTDIFLVQIGKKAQKKVMSLISELSEKHYSVGCAVGKETLSAQLKVANKVRAKLALIIGQREMLDKTIIVKDMIEATQETVDQDDIETYINKKLDEKKS